MCYEFFMRCNTDETAYYSVCADLRGGEGRLRLARLHRVRPEVEELDGNAPDAWRLERRTSAGLTGEGSPVFETAAVHRGVGLTRRGAVIDLFAAVWRLPPSYA